MAEELLIHDIESLLWLKSRFSNQADADLIQRAFDFASEAHKTQRRISGAPYFTHPLAVACILADIGMDASAISAGLLHDVVEDTDTPLDEVLRHFGEDIALIVDGVTKLSKLEVGSKAERQAESFRKLFLAMAKDIRVIMIKLADRLHNMRTLDAMTAQKQKEISMETMEIYVPLAHRLGIFGLKNELEDLCLLYLDEEMHAYITERLGNLRMEREVYISQVISIIHEKLEADGISSEITGRPKHLHSIYRKMISQNKDINEIYDLVAVRIIVGTVADCYASMGIIHTVWVPIPGRFKDFIAMPKENGYQSLHTTVMGEKGEPFEIQIRTEEMHRIAEYGVAAHWVYKEGEERDYDKHFEWLRQSLEWQSEVEDNEEYLEMLRMEMFQDIVFAFTPKGDVMELPLGATALDFAYRVHTDIGHRCIGCKVNGRIANLDYVVKSGDIVEVLTAKSSNPKEAWKQIVKTSNARNKINNWLNRERRGDNLEKGKDLLEQAIKRIGQNGKSYLKDEVILGIAKTFGCQSLDDLLVSLGDGSVTLTTLVNKLKEEYYKNILPEVSDAEVEARANELGAIAAKKKESTLAKASGKVIIRGVDNVMTRLSRCCNPLPGDPIVGYVTRGRGVSIHHVGCANARHYLKEEQGRIMEVAWDADLLGTFTSELEIESRDRNKLTIDIISTVQDIKVPIHEIHSREGKNGIALTNLKVEIKNLDHLQYVMERIARVKDVTAVQRVVPGAAETAGEA